ncbi:Binding-protein-dependent transport system inner membrane component [uncultured archaeon]|nr:Binding-protein-dependent transport system inner membrane component [uncultured archaeon]
MIKGLSLIIFLAVLITGFYYLDITSSQNSSPFLLLLLTLFRMFFALLLSLAFGLFFGYLAARSSRAERLVIPVLDILQSVPIVGFFPLVFVLFLTTFPGLIGIELSCIFLIFTSMAWNLAFGVFESWKTRDPALDEVANSFGLTNKLKFLKVFLPSVSPTLIYNSILSWSIAWFFLLVSEVISVGNSTNYVHGVGSFLAFSAIQGNLPNTLIGLGLILSSVLFIYVFVWKPLLKWSKSYYLKPEKSIFIPRYYNDFYEFLGNFLSEAVKEVFEILFFFYDIIKPYRKKILYGLFYILILGSLYFVLQTAYYLFSYGFDSSLSSIPLAILYSFLRILIAYLLSLLWIFPVCFLIYKYKLSFFDVISQAISSLPASALFPLIALVFSGGILSEVGVIIMIMLGMMWYLFFNVLAGFNSIPSDLEEASKVFKLNSFLYFKRVLFPAVIPSLIVGSITAWGAGWNALVISEVASFGHTTYHQLGIGSLLVDSVAKGSQASTGVIIIVFVLVVLLLNKVVWKKLLSHKLRVN